MSELLLSFACNELKLPPCRCCATDGAILVERLTALLPADLQYLANEQPTNVRGNNLPDSQLDNYLKQYSLAMGDMFL